MAVLRPRSLKNLLLVHEIAFLVLVAVTGIVTGLSIYYWQQTSAESVRVNNLIYLSEQIRGELFRQIQEALRARVLEDTGALGVYSEYSRRIDRDFNQLRQNSGSRREDRAIQEMQTAYREIQKDMNKIFGDPYQVNFVVQLKILDPRFAEHMVDRFENKYSDFKLLLRQRHSELERTRRLWTRFSPVAIPVVFALAVLLVAVTSRVLRAQFVRPMAVLKEGASIISQGRLDHRIPEQGVTEAAELAASINVMARDLASSRDALVSHEKQAALGALVPVVAHNIRNPLASIRACAQLLDEHASAADIGEARQAIIETIDRLGRWVNALVAYLHPLQPSFSRVPASRLMEAAITVMRARLEEKSIELVRENWNMDEPLLVDPDLMEQAIAGLLGNAIDASPPGGRVTIRFSREPHAFAIGIIDSGPGIPFSPVPGGLEPGPSTKKFGTGLGIPVAFKICQHHGWELLFAPGSGAGTSVLIRVPNESETRERT